MDQQVDDEEFEQLLGEIPRATSAPPHLEELQRAYGSQMDQDSPFVVVREDDTVAVKPFTDIRYDELYEDFYRAYSGQKKLPPPMENRMLYGDMLSPKSSVNQSVISSFYSQGLDSPRGVHQQRQRELQHMHQKQEQEQQEQHDQQQKRLQLQRLQQQQQQQQQPSDSPLHRRRASVGSFPLDELSSAFGHLDFGDESLHTKNTHAMAPSSKVNRAQAVDVSNDLRMGRSASLDAIAGAALSAVASGAAGAGYENGNGGHTHSRVALVSGNGNMGSRLDSRMDGYGGGGGQSANSSLDVLTNDRALMAGGMDGFSSRQGETYQRQSGSGIDTYHRRSLSSPSPGIDHHFGNMSGNAAGGLGGGGNIGEGRGLRSEGVGNRDVDRRVDSGTTLLEGRTNNSQNSASYEQLLHHQRSSSSGSPPGMDMYNSSTGIGMRNAPMESYPTMVPGGVDVYSMAAAVQATAARMFPEGAPPGLDMYSAAAAQVAAALAAQAQHHQLQPQQQQGLASQRGLSMPASGFDVTSILQQQQARASQMAAMQAQIRQQQLAAEDDRARQHQLQQHLLLQQQHQLQDRTFTSPPPGQYLHGNHSPTRAALNPLRHSSPPSHLSSSYPPHSPPPFHKRGPLSGSGYDSPTWGGQHTQPHSPTGPAHGSTCRYFAQGYCSRGDACPFTHSPSQAERLLRAQERTSNLSHKEHRAPAPLARDDRAERGSAYSDKQLPRRSPRGGVGVAGITEIGRSRGEASVFSGRRGKVDTGVLANGYSNGHQNREEIQAGHGHHSGQRGEHGSERSRSGRSSELLDFDYDASALSVRHGHGSPPSHGQHSERAGGSQLKSSGHSDGTPSPPPSGQAPKYSTLEEVEGRIYAIAKDQHGCRFLQRKFDEGGPEEVAKIFGEIVEHIIELMTDPFGNYLVQKLLEVCNEGQRKDILDRVTRQSELISISLNMHGTRAVQKLIETLTSPEQVQMVIRALKPGVVTLIKDLNGNHVVQRCLQRLSNDDSQFIFDAAATHCVEIATHRHGCCVLQRCVDYASGAQRQRLVAEIAANAYVLSQDPFGNYVVQYILDLQMPWASAEVMVRLEGNYPQLAMQKFSSNVVEKCLKLAQEENRNRIVRELIATPRLGQLLQDPYANYVVQSALSVSKGALHNGLVEAIKPHLPALRSSPYGKRILSRTNLKKG